MDKALLEMVGRSRHARHLTFLIWLASTSMACTAGSNLPLPANEGGFSAAIIALVERFGDVHAWAVDLSSFSPTVPVSAPAESGARLELLSYFESLDDLAIQEGMLHENPDGRPIPGPDLVQGSDFPPDDPPTWRMSPEISAPLAAFRFGETAGGPCTEFEQRVIELGPTMTDQIRTIATLDDRSVLVASRDGIVRVTDAGEARRMSARPSEIVEQVTASTVLPNGTLILGGAQGQLWRVTDVSEDLLTAEVLTSSASLAAILWIDGRADELYVLGRRNTGEPGLFARWFEGRWEQLSELRLGAGDGSRDATDNHILYVGPGEAFAVSRYEPEVHHFLAGRVEREPIELLLGAGPVELAQPPGYPPLAGSVKLFARSESGWRFFSEEKFSKITRIEPFRDGFLVIATAEIYQYLGALDSFCEAVPILDGGENNHAARLGDSFVLGGRRELRGTSAITLLTPLD
jgi:hypothetical protein